MTKKKSQYSGRTKPNLMGGLADWIVAVLSALGLCKQNVNGQHYATPRNKNPTENS